MNKSICLWQNNAEVDRLVNFTQAKWLEEDYHA